MSYTRFRYHIVTATKDRQPLITAEIEERLYSAIKRKAENMSGRVLYINGIEDHVHIIAAIPPAVAVSQFVGGIKATSSFYINKWKGDDGDKFAWQDGYGAFTVSPYNMQNLIDYVLNQKVHHKLGTINKDFERMEE